MYYNQHQPSPYCTKCDKTFEIVAHLKNHKCGPHVDSSNICDKCDKSPVSDSNSDVHSSDCSFSSIRSSISVINQLDGNVSISSDESFSSKRPEKSMNQTPQSIPVIIGNCPPPPARTKEKYHRNSVLKTLRRSNKAIQGLSLPVISNYNMRSLLPKLDFWAEDFEERSIGLSLLSEVWEKATK